MSVGGRIAGYYFVQRLISAAFEGKTGVVEPSYVYTKDEASLASEIGESLDFFSVPVELGVSYSPLLPLSRVGADVLVTVETARGSPEASPRRQALELRGEPPQGCSWRAFGFDQQCVLFSSSSPSF